MPRLENSKFINALVEWLEHKSWCASVNTYHDDKVTGEKVGEPCNCGLKTLRTILVE